MLDIFRQATASALSLLGEGALLRLTEPCQVNIERDVQLTGMDTEFETARDTRAAIMRRDVMTIHGDLNPKTRDVVRVGPVDVDGTIPIGRSYRLDVLLEDCGAFRRFAIIDLGP